MQGRRAGIDWTGEVECVPLTIALDAAGGDHAPVETVRGAAQAVEELGVRVLLVGPAAAIERELDRSKAVRRGLTASLEVVPAEETISMDESPAVAVRSKRNSPPVVAARLVRDGHASGFVSAGSTGAALAASLFVLGRIEGIDRPALATTFPTVSGHCLLLDIGANVDCRPGFLAQFAVMGSLYSERVLGVHQPRVGLLSIGEEETKGNQLSLEAYSLIKPLKLNFVGNVEGKDIPTGLADVVVSDGFVGNVVLKLAEGMASLAFHIIRTEAKKRPLAMLGALLMRPAFRGVRQRIDYEEYGGAPLLGVRGVAIVAHGRSKARAIRNAIRVARDAAESELVRHIAEGIAAAPEIAAHSRRTRQATSADANGPSGSVSVEDVEDIKESPGEQGRQAEIGIGGSGIQLSRQGED